LSEFEAVFTLERKATQRNATQRKITHYCCVTYQ